LRRVAAFLFFNYLFFLLKKTDDEQHKTTADGIELPSLNGRVWNLTAELTAHEFHDHYLCLMTSNKQQVNCVEVKETTGKHGNGLLFKVDAESSKL